MISTILNFKKKRFSRNAILIIGNGFDLAHNLKTSYGDFADYLMEKFFDNENIKDTKFNIDNNHQFIKQNFIAFIRARVDEKYNSQVLSGITGKSKKFLESFINYNLNLSKSFNIKSEFLEHGIAKEILKNELLGVLFSDSIDVDWFDIEKKFFITLLNKNFNSGKDIKKLNDNLQEIKEELIKYLKEIKPLLNEEIKTMFESNFMGKESIYCVNFNYTNTIKEYVYSIYGGVGIRTEIEINSIHGELSDPINIVFGYGDDTSDAYKDLKNKDLDELLKNFKTRYYLLDNKYSNLMSKIEDYQDYEVYVLGHSLARTDKTLLKSIMDSDKCLRIHLFKRDFIDEEKNRDSFSSLTNNILRIFDNDIQARNKIVDYLSITSLKLDARISNRFLKNYYRKIYGNEVVKILFKNEKN